MAEPSFIDGEWIANRASTTFDASNPRTGESTGAYPISSWEEIDRALGAGFDAYKQVSVLDPDRLAVFLDLYADRLEAHTDNICRLAATETALPVSPRLSEVEMPRTTAQLRQAAAAIRDRSWTRPTLTTSARIASMLRPVPGVALVFGPNNFPFAFNGVSGGDFAAAVASGHPVIAKANPGHPGTSLLMAREAAAAVQEAELPDAFVQMIYRTSHNDGAAMVSDPRVAATAYTGSKAAGLALKAAADAVGKPIYLEMSSINPLIVLPGAWRERGEDLAAELATSALLGVGQFCTSPGLILAAAGDENAALRTALARRLDSAPSGTLLDERVEASLEDAKRMWSDAGATMVTTTTNSGEGCSFPNTLMAVDAATFLSHSHELQAEAFGNMSLFVDVPDVRTLAACVDALEPSLTGSVYSAADGSDDATYDAIARPFSERVGRLLNDKAPTGVAVVPSMNHGGPYPATGHPGFTAVGIPRSIERFGMLQSFDNVRVDRLPDELKPDNPLAIMRLVDGSWTDAAVEW